MRVCPECDRQGDVEICPVCGTRTLLEAPSDPGIDPLLGRVFEGRYRLESLLGRGGMGAVYMATQITMNKVVAVKVVKPEFAANTEAAKRFHREAKAASSLSHPHTIRVFDFGQTPQRELYMAMEYLAGRSLGKVLREGPRLPLQRALKIVAEIASSLVEAHERGLVHRDLKPENVILLKLANDPDFVKVLDFGIAKFLSGSSGDSTVTRTGAVIGTPQYMAPEQARASRSLTTAADVYSLGVMLYEVLAGALPFTGDSPIDMLMAHVNQPVPELPAGVEVPDDVRHLLERMLAKEPAERPTAAEVADALEEASEREKALSFLARSGAHAAGRAPAPAALEASLAAYAETAAPATEAIIADAAPLIVNEPTAAAESVAMAGPADAEESESLEFALPAPRGVSRRVFLVAGLAFLVVAGGLLAWALLKGAPAVSGDGNAASKPAVPRAAERPAPAVQEPQPTKAEPAAAPDPIEAEPAVAAPTPVESEPALATPKPTDAEPAPTPKPTEPAPAVAAPPKPAEVKPAPVVAPKPAPVKAKPAARKPKVVAPKPAAAKRSAPPNKENSDYRTPAVW